MAIKPSAFRAQHGDRYHYWDLAEEWNRLTCFPFVFALWLIRPEVSEPETVAAKLRARRDANLRTLDQVIAAGKNFSFEFCLYYLTECVLFGFGAQEKAGLVFFHSLCQRHGILPTSRLVLRVSMISNDAER